MSDTENEFICNCCLKDVIPTDFMRGVLILLFLTHASKSSYDMFFPTQFSMNKCWFVPDDMPNSIPVHYINTIKNKIFTRVAEDSLLKLNCTTQSPSIN